jgi:hypothetical protein
MRQVENGWAFDAQVKRDSASTAVEGGAMTFLPG